MKRIISVVICLIMAFSALSVSAANVPNFMKQDYNNYTADYTLNLSFDSGEELVALLEEVGAAESMSKHLDMKSFFEGLINTNQKMNLQLNMTADYKKIDVALTGEYDKCIKPNMNLDIDYIAKYGMWLHLDVDKEELDLIYSTPIHQKYAYLNETEIPEELREQFFDALNAVLNKDFMEEYEDALLEIMMEHADVSMKGSKCVVKYDNEAFIAMLTDVTSYVSEMTESMAQSVGEQDYEAEFLSLDGLKILGDKGITITYYLKGTKLDSAEIEADICIGIAEIYEKACDEPWPYEASGYLDFTLKSKMQLTKMGTTKPMMPVLTEENSFSVADEIFWGYEYYDEEYYDEEYYDDYAYASSWASCYDVEEVEENGTYFVPLRELIEDAHYNCSEITYDKGRVTAILTNPEDESFAVNLSFCVGDNKVLVTKGEETAEYITDKAHKMVNGKVFVSTDFFEKSLGWTLNEMYKDLLNNTMSYEYDTGYWFDY